VVRRTPARQCHRTGMLSADLNNPTLPCRTPVERPLTDRM